MNKACAVGAAISATSACTAAEVNSVGEEEGEESNNKVVFFVWGKVANDGETFDKDDDDDANEVRDEEGEEGSSVDSGDDDKNMVEMEEAADEDIEGETLGT